MISWKTNYFQKFLVKDLSMKLHNIHPCSKLLIGSKLNAPTSGVVAYFYPGSEERELLPGIPHLEIMSHCHHRHFLPLVPLLGHQVLSREGLETYPVTPLMIFCAFASSNLLLDQRTWYSNPASCEHRELRCVPCS